MDTFLRLCCFLTTMQWIVQYLTRNSLSIWIEIFNSQFAFYDSFQYSPESNTTQKFHAETVEH